MHTKKTEKMAESIHPQEIEQGRGQNGDFPPKKTGHAPRVVPAIISKKWLCVHFELQYPNGRMNYARLYRLVLTPHVIEAMGFTSAQVRQRDIKEFDALTSARLKQILRL